ncbi:putative serine/threonine-protein kinase N isoform X2 [Penaeus vannamei]|uniref:Putative serine/threonine-protein kinase N isoform X2 n=1 Tax=Penaeus vannamei TaxID=6689 RepID=A0A3R7T004_PENVA|nr:putative serine/threonine-protein kinase N isoform X2 [Penaeus vannamei]
MLISEREVRAHRMKASGGVQPFNGCQDSEGAGASCEEFLSHGSCSVKRELENSLSASPSPANYTSLYDKENYPSRRSQALHSKGAAVTGKLEVRLIGVQDLLEDVPGRSRRDSHSGPSDLKSFMKGVTGKSSKSYSVKDEISNEVMAVLKLDNNKVVGQTSWKPCSQSAWDQRFSIDLDKSRDLEIDIYWRDWRSLCAVKFLRLEEFIDDVRHGMALQLEPKGLLFTEIKFLNPMISRKPKLQRQKKLFMQKGKVLRPNQMNINVAAWGRLIKNIQPSHEPVHLSYSGGHTGAITSASSATPITPGPRTVPTRLDFDSEKTPGEVCQHRPLALSEVRPLNMGVVSPPQVPAHLESPSVAPPPPSITFGAPTQTQQLPSTPALMTVYPTPHGSVYDEPAHGTPSTPAHHSVFPVTQTPTIHPAHSITVQVAKRPTSTPPPPPPRPHSGTVTISVPASPVESDVKVGHAGGGDGQAVTAEVISEQDDRRPAPLVRTIWDWFLFWPFWIKAVRARFKVGVGEVGPFGVQLWGATGFRSQVRCSDALLDLSYIASPPRPSESLPFLSSSPTFPSPPPLLQESQRCPRSIANLRPPRASEPPPSLPATGFDNGLYFA